MSRPVVAADHRAIVTTVGADLGFNANIGNFVDGLRATASRGDPGLSVYLAGPAASAADQIKIFKGIDTTLLFATLAVVIVLLLITYRGALIGLGATGGVITSARLVLAGTFAMLGTLPLVTFTEIGFTVALGVLLDTQAVEEASTEASMTAVH